MCCGSDSIDGDTGGTLAPWQRVAYLDFAAESAAIDLTDGQHTLNDGRSWTAVNRAAASLFEVTPGVGLRFSAAGVLGQWNTAPAQTASALWISINDPALAADRRLVPTYDVHRQYVIRAYVPQQDADESTEGVYLNLWNAAGNQFPGSALVIGGAWLGSNGTVLANQGVGAASGSSTPVLIPINASPWLGTNVIGVETTPGQASAIMCTAGIFGADWPPMSEMRECGGFATTATPFALTAARYNDRTHRVCLAFPTGNARADFTATVRALEVLARNPN